jgi:putative transposase
VLLKLGGRREDENRKLKLMVADLSLENRAIKDVLNPKALTPDEKRWIAVQLQQHGLSQRAACRAVSLSRSVFAYERQTEPDEPIIAALQELAERFPDRGFSKYYKLIRRRGRVWNHKRIYPVYCALGLNRHRLGKKRLPPRDPAPLAVPALANHNWSNGLHE